MKVKRDSYIYLYVRNRIIREINACGSTCVGDIIGLTSERLISTGLSGKALHGVVHTAFDDMVKLRRIEVMESYAGRPRGVYYKFANVLERIVGAVECDGSDQPDD